MLSHCLLSFTFIATALLPAFAQNQEAPPQTHGIDVANMDRSVKPGDNFFEFANSAWVQRTEIPPDRPGISVFSQLSDVSDKRTAGLIDEIAKNKPAAGSGKAKIADLYNSFMDEVAVDAKGMGAIKPHLDAIAAIADKQQLAAALGKTLRADVDALNNTNFHTPNLLGLWVAPGFDDSTHYTAYLLQGGVELPDREYYVADTEKMRDIRAKYQAHVAAMLKLAGFSDPEARAERIIALEHAIAEKHLSLAEDQDVHKANNTWTQADFAKKAPGLNWAEFFRAAGLGQKASFIVWQPSAFIAESALVASTPLETWKDWLSYHLVENSASYLSKPFADEYFAFFGTVLTGQPQQRPRWQSGVVLANRLLGDEVGQVYAQRYFSPDAKAQVEQMVTNIVAAFNKRIDALTWMAASTKAEAKAKLSTLYVGIGYPETWIDYSGYDVKADDLFGNVWNGALFQYHRQLARLGKDVNPREWTMFPQTVNAVNLPLQNALCFPAAILQPPFFDPQAPAAANYGAIGSVIGHEVSHTFDTEGSAFDSKGRLRNWWTPSDLSHFEEAATKLAQQYDSYEPFPGAHINGKQTLAENIADLAGIAASYDGYHAWLGSKTAPVQEGFSGDQQFFIAFGQNYASKQREALLRRQVLTDPHSPGLYRASTVRNIDGWYSSFEVQPGQTLYLAPPDRVRIW
jgi:endothelin-converting enzyme/putative endopeptidase